MKEIERKKVHAIKHEQQGTLPRTWKSSGQHKHEQQKAKANLAALLAQQENQPPEAQTPPPPPHNNPSWSHPANPLDEGNRLSPDRAGRGHLSRRETRTSGLYTEFSEHKGSGQVYFPDVASGGDMDEGGEMDGNDSSEMSEATAPCPVIF